MTRNEDKVKRWRIRIWQLFAVIAFVALILWLAQHVSFGIGFGKVDENYEGYLLLRWDQYVLVDLDTMKDEYGVQVFP